MAAELLACVGFSRAQAAKALAFVGRAYKFTFCAINVKKSRVFDSTPCDWSKIHHLLEINLEQLLLDKLRFSRQIPRKKK